MQSGVRKLVGFSKPTADAVHAFSYCSTNHDQAISQFSMPLALLLLSLPTVLEHSPSHVQACSCLKALKAWSAIDLADAVTIAIK